MDILVVDDELDQLESLARGLRRKGYGVVRARCVAEALRCLERDSGRIRLVITDYAMPGGDGLDLLKAVRCDHGDMPVIMMTAYGEKETAMEALSHRCDGFIEKPFSLSELAEGIDKALEGREKESSLRRFTERIPRLGHQLNNPLASIMGSAELGLIGPVDRYTAEKRLQAVLHAVDKIKEIKQEISRLGRGRVMEAGEVIDLAALAERSLEAVRDPAELRGIKVAARTGTRRALIRGNSFGLEQLIRNLLQNAVEAMEVIGQGRVVLEVKENPDKGTVDLVVEERAPASLRTLRRPFFPPM